MSLKTDSRWSNWSWDKPVKAFIWRSSRMSIPIGGLPPWFFEDSLPDFLLRNNSNALPPVDWCWWHLWCYKGNAAMSIVLRFQCMQTGIGLLQGLVHIVWGESVSCNLCHDEVFRHFEQGLGHGIFLGRGCGKEQWLVALAPGLGMGAICTRFPEAILS